MDKLINEIIEYHFSEINSKQKLPEDAKEFLFNQCKEEERKMERMELASDALKHKKAKEEIEKLEKQIKREEERYAEAEEWSRNPQTYIEVNPDGTRERKIKDRKNDRAPIFAFIRFRNSVLIDFLKARYIETKEEEVQEENMYPFSGKKNNLEVAKWIIQEAKKDGEAKFQEAINETLPIQLEVIPKDEYLTHYLSMLKNCQKWYKEHYKPYFDFRKHGWERVAEMMKDLLNDIDKGMKWPPFENPFTVVSFLSERIFIVKYMKYLKVLIDGQPGELNISSLRHSCTTKEFRKDVSELCQECPLPEKFRTAIKNQILVKAQSRYENLSFQSFKEYIDAEKEDALKNMDELVNQAQNPGAIMPALTKAYLWNKERIKALNRFLEDKEKENQQTETKQPATPRSFGHEIVEVVKYALEEKELLTTAGQYIGKKMQIKALYNVLVKRGYILGIKKPEENFVAWFLDTFSGDISARALRNPPSKGQEEEETEFKALIPEKK